MPNPSQRRDNADDGDDAMSWRMPLPQLRAWSRSFLGLVAFVLALTPSVLKMYESSHWFRTGDPSVSDAAEEWFENPRLPYEGPFQSARSTMRVYMLVFPYMLSAVILLIMRLIAPPSKKQATKGRAQVLAHSMLRLTISFPMWMVRLGAPFRVSVGECVGVYVFCIINFGTMIVRIKRSLPRGSRKLDYLIDDGDVGKEPIDAFSWQACEVWAKTLGVIIVVNVGWYLLMPVGRRSILLEALGMSWERGIKYHRWVGYYTVLIMVIHSCMYIAVFVRGNGDESWDPDRVMVRHNLVPWGCRGENECDEDQRRLLRISMYGWVCLILVTIMTVLALPWFRRNKYEWFYYSHHLFILLLIFLCLHYPGSIIYLIPGIAVYGVDKIMGLFAYKSSILARTCMVSSDVLEVQIDLAPGVTYKAGQYIFLNVPEVSFLEWHPFSITSAPGGGSASHNTNNTIVFHIKGLGTWTKQVLDCAALFCEGTRGDLRVRVDGFYGEESGLEQHKDGAILVGGGIGFTPMMSMAMGLLRETTSRNVSLFWVVRTIDEFRIFSKELGRHLHMYGVQQDRLNVKVWLTLSQPEPVLVDSHNGDDKEALYASVEQSAMAELDANEQLIRVINVLQSQPRQEIQNHKTKNHDLSDVDSRSSDFLPAGFSNTPLLNILVMLFAMLMMLNSYAFTSWIVNEYRPAITQPIDKGTVFHISMMVVTLVVVNGLAILFKRLVRVIQGRIGYDSEMSILHESHTGHMHHDSETNSHKDSSNTSSHDGNFDHNQNGTNGATVVGEEDLIQIMLEGNIGCRPNLRREFLHVAATAVTQDDDGVPPDIGVIACGPVAMIKEINDICNSGGTAGLFSMGIGEDGAIFAFTEDDWEW